MIKDRRMDHCRILIVGAGLAGLSLARALRQAGLAPQVIEREAGRGVAGTGIYLPANGVRALRTPWAWRALWPPVGP
jgi:2-polyprenyl-6-methoxyphenol hydroxylase-like FAD-dependent oxidoreductase